MRTRRSWIWFYRPGRRDHVALRSTEETLAEGDGTLNEGPLVAEGQWTIGLVFCLSLLVFTGIGILSSTRKKKTTSDYLLAGRGVSPWLVGLSAFSTNCSGFMFVGMIGFTAIVVVYCYSGGIRASIWTDAAQPTDRYRLT